MTAIEPQALDAGPRHAAADQASLAVVICTHNRAAYVEAALASVLRAPAPQGLVLDVLVVDNNSTDDTRDVVARHAAASPVVRYVEEAQQGLSFARNRGVAETHADFILFLDDDAELAEGYLEALAPVLRNERPDFFGGPVLPRFEAPPPGWFDPLLETRRYADESGFSRTVSISGSNYGVRRAILERVGVFLTNIGMSGGAMGFGEDRELLERYRAATPAKDQRVYYGLEFAILHTVRPEKLELFYQMRRNFSMAASRERVFRRAGTRALWRARLNALADLALCPIEALGTALINGMGPRGWALAAIHVSTTLGRAAGAFA